MFLVNRYLPTIEWSVAFFCCMIFLFVDCEVHVFRSGQAAFAKADRLIWKVNPTDEEVAGFVARLFQVTQNLTLTRKLFFCVKNDRYTQQAGDFTYAIIRGAGHIAPYDQGRFSVLYFLFILFYLFVFLLMETRPVVFCSCRRGLEGPH